MAEIIRRRLRVRGIVQGVGFRPFVFGLANRLKLAGHVGNDPAGVFIELQGSPPAVERFLALLVAHPPAQARITAVEVENLPPVAGAGAFVIEESRAAALAGESSGERETKPVRTLVSPDLAICDQCAREIADPADRHYRYPFTNCTHCGPRYTIIQALPYDRRQTTLAGAFMPSRWPAQAAALTCTGIP
jgi:hydrogenase maturation protein HypF